MKTKYMYALLVKNVPSMNLDNLSTIIPVKIEETDYALIIRVVGEVNKSGDVEKDLIILYDNDYEYLKTIMEKQVSWYDYVEGMSKDMQGNIRKLP